MSQVARKGAVRSFTHLQLVVNGGKQSSRNLYSITANVVSIGAVLAMVAVAQYWVGGHWKALWHWQAFSSVFGITFFLSLRHIGFWGTLRSLRAVVLGPTKDDHEDSHFREFCEQAPRWAIQSAGLFGLLGLIRAFSLSNPIEGFGLVILSFVYGGVLHSLFSTRTIARNEKRYLIDYLIPGIVMLGLFYYTYNFVLRR